MHLILYSSDEGQGRNDCSLLNMFAQKWSYLYCSILTCSYIYGTSSQFSNRLVENTIEREIRNDHMASFFLGGFLLLNYTDSEFLHQMHC